MPLFMFGTPQLHIDLDIPLVKDVIQSLAVKYERRLHNHPNHLALDILAASNVDTHLTWYAWKSGTLVLPIILQPLSHQRYHTQVCYLCTSYYPDHQI